MAKAIIAMDDDARKRLAVGPRDAAGRNAWLRLVGIAVKSLKDVE
jgi:hypothetical protein